MHDGQFVNIQLNMINLLGRLCILPLICILIIVASCHVDNTTDNKLSYDLAEVLDSDVEGSLVFTELTDGRIQAEISLSGTGMGDTHPAYIMNNSAAFGGNILISLTPVEGSTGRSVTVFDKTDIGQELTFDGLSYLHAHVNIYKSANQLNVLLAQGDIGGNELTDTKTEIELREEDIEDISGTMMLYLRKNGGALCVIELDNTPAGGRHPAFIRSNSAVEGGLNIIILNTVDGDTGISKTEITTAIDGRTYDYEDLLSLNGHVSVQLSTNQQDVIIATGDIGSNMLTGESVTYNLAEKDVEGISGTVTFQQRNDGTALATLELRGTPAGGMHPAHVHNNSVDEGGDVAVSFTPVGGTTGRSVTSIRTTDDGTAITYLALTNYNGYVNVHLSATELQTIVAQGNIGLNVN